MKYIVYLTENIQNNKIYVGVHKTENPDIFDGYYGNGINIKDQSKLKHPKEPFHYALKKYGFKNFRRNTIKVFDTLEEALELEKQIVDQDFINRKDTYNITLGGGMPLIKQVIVYQFSLDGTLLNSYESIKSASKIINIDDSAIGYAIKNKTTSGGYLWATTKTINIEDYTTSLQRKEVYLYTKEGEFAYEFKSLSECSRFLGMSIGPVQRAYYQKWKIGDFYISDQKLNYYKPEKIQCNGDYHQYSLDGSYIRTFTSRKELMEYFGCNMDGINQSIRMGKPYKEYLWCRGDKQESVKPYKLKEKTRKVGQYTLDGQLVKIYNTVREARKDFGNVNKVLKGLAKQCKGYTFKYIS